MLRKVVVIIGGSAGMGRHIAIAFAESGYDIGLTYKNHQADALILMNELEKFNIKCRIEPLDVSSEVDIISVSQKFLNFFGKIDVLINNVGVFKDSLVKNMDLASWKELIDINLTGVFINCREYFKIMEKQNFGRIINIGSVVGSTGAYGAANYASSKSGLIGLTKSLAKEGGRYNITVNVIALGYMNEGMGLKIPEKIKIKILGQIPLRAFGDPKKAAQMIVHFASSDAEYITGQIIGINGGIYM